MNLSALTIATTASDTSGSSASLLTQGELPKDFVDLLSKRISQVADTSGKKTLDKVDEEALLSALGKDNASLSRDDLNALLSSFSSLTGATITAGKQNPEIVGQAKFKNLDKKESDSTANDAIAMQALLAMLQTTPLPTQPAADSIAATAVNAGVMIPGLIDAKRQNEASASLLNNTGESAKGTLAKLLDASVMPDKDAGISRDLHHAAKQTSSATTESADEAAKFALTTPNSLAGDRNVSESVSTLGNGASQTTPPVAQAMHIQPASVGTTTPAPQAASAQLNAPFGSPQWQDALGQQIIMFSRNGQQTVELRLNPQELGALHISLKIDDNQAQIHLASASGQVRSALEAALPHLRNAMAESGINLGQSSVGSDSSAWQQQMAGNNNDGNNRGPSYQQQFGHSSDSTSELLDVPEQLRSMASSVNGVDIFA
ncbi:flagellar hook-length control protein FliK [Pectobacterium versatile]|jgi:flagellar hook-length control protein FliK|uniref:flagellar hook-length control protein FliK n=1 Tax=Pectobacterium versatile TaxID=2488639 RepID=UPI00102EDC2B|nr:MULTISPECIES: flagellar hook-length control protein FliK [Pectobacterium]MBQ4771676.1 flagellar hook-length control protein FliK [Pectobacterium versatile]MCA6914568.1 flagellar hook-length control protein FliK [Pectobacterium versatile]MCA6925407.1 flagellar hook-length control protein FliK [Pectobacterium versatile]MCH5082164.1 flagellar hook-length control protein FliK [Pectobacterium versatile]MCL6333924.1 flagellar hook-length control protein FliK [Pectobacterium carotovorum subsp. car